PPHRWEHVSRVISKVLPGITFALFVPVCCCWVLLLLVILERRLCSCRAAALHASPLPAHSSHRPTHPCLIKRTRPATLPTFWSIPGEVQLMVRTACPYLPLFLHTLPKHLQWLILTWFGSP